MRALFRILRTAIVRFLAGRMTIPAAELPRTAARVAVAIAGCCLFALQPASGQIQQTQQVISAIKAFFYGRAFIANQPADDGTYVDAVIVRGVNNYTVCGQTRVGQGTKLFDVAKLGAGAYMLSIDMTPQCLNPQNRYTLFINSVNATSVPNPGFTPNGGSSARTCMSRKWRWSQTDRATLQTKTRPWCTSTVPSGTREASCVPARRSP